jgi:putative AlgH/UPF0301 family transcriptional regulator
MYVYSEVRILQEHNDWGAMALVVVRPMGHGVIEEVLAFLVPQLTCQGQGV